MTGIRRLAAAVAMTLFATLAAAAGKGAETWSCNGSPVIYELRFVAFAARADAPPPPETVLELGGPWLSSTDAARIAGDLHADVSGRLPWGYAIGERKESVTSFWGVIPDGLDTSVRLDAQAGATGAKTRAVELSIAGSAPRHIGLPIGATRGIAFRTKAAIVLVLVTAGRCHTVGGDAGTGILATAEPGVEPAVLEQRVEPEFPERALHDRVRQASVGLSFILDADGVPKDPLVFDAPLSRPEFIYSAVSATMKWRYQPARRDGAAVRILISTRVSYAMH